MKNRGKQKTVFAKLNDGRVVAIDNASKMKEIKHPGLYDYLGKGVHFNPDAKPEHQYGENEYHFYKRKG